MKLEDLLKPQKEYTKSIGITERKPFENLPKEVQQALRPKNIGNTSSMLEKTLSGESFKELEQICKSSKQRVIKYFNQLGIIDIPDISIKAVKQDNTFNFPDIIGLAKQDTESMLEITGKESREKYCIIAKQGFGIDLSQAGQKQYIESHTRKIREKLEGDLLKGANVIIFDTYKRKGYTLKDVESFIAHEIYHKIEIANGINYIPGILREGTATYVQNIYQKKEVKLEENGNYQQQVYANMAYYIDIFMKEKEVTNPTLTLSKGTYKKDLELLFQEKISPNMTAKKKRNVQDILWLHQNDRQYRIQKELEYEDFRTNPSKETLLLALKKTGLEIIAQELEFKDITLFLEYHKALLAMPA